MKKPYNRKSRREFLRKLIAAGTVAGVAPYINPLGLLAAQQRGVLPKRPLGKTGHMVSIFSLGGQATIETIGKEEKAVEIINGASDKRSIYGPLRLPVFLVSPKLRILRTLDKMVGRDPLNEN